MGKALNEALFKFQKLCPKVVKNCENPYHKSRYADLEAIMDTVKPVLEQCGLILQQTLQGKELVTKLIHLESGEFETETCPIIYLEDGNAQRFFAGTTYAKRYSVSILLGLIAEEDDDGNTASGLKVDKTLTTAKKIDLKPVSDTNKAVVVDNHEVHYTDLEEADGFTIKITGFETNKYIPTMNSFTVESNKQEIKYIGVNKDKTEQGLEVGAIVTFHGIRETIKNGKKYYNAKSVSSVF